jgi:hypothetical protein
MHEPPATTADMAVLPGVLGSRAFRRTEKYASGPSPCGYPVARPSPRSRDGVSCIMRARLPLSMPRLTPSSWIVAGGSHSERRCWDSCSPSQKVHAQAAKEKRHRSPLIAAHFTAHLSDSPPRNHLSVDHECGQAPPVLACYLAGQGR